MKDEYHLVAAHYSRIIAHLAAVTHRIANGMMVKCAVFFVCQAKTRARPLVCITIKHHWIHCRVWVREHSREGRKKVWQRMMYMWKTTCIQVYWSVIMHLIEYCALYLDVHIFTCIYCSFGLLLWLSKEKWTKNVHLFS